MFLFSAKIRNERKKEKKMDVSFHFYLFFKPQLHMFIMPYERLYKSIVGLFLLENMMFPQIKDSLPLLYLLYLVCL